jgi:hypothetical protein
MRESDIEKQCDRHAEAYGYTVIRLSQRRRSRVHPGLPDRRYQGKRGAFWFEVKPGDGQLSEAQFRFLIAELEGGCLASVGGVLEIGELMSTLVKAPRDAMGVCRKHVQFWAARGFRREAA